MSHGPSLTAMRPARLLTPIPSGVMLRVALTLGLPLLILALLVERGTADVPRLAEVIIASLLVLLVARYPGPGMAAAVLFVPLLVFLSSLLLRFGAPTPVVRGLGSVKDVLVLGLLVNAIRTGRRLGHRLDAADKFAVGLVLLILLYLVAPSAVAGLLGSSSFHVRLLAARVNGLFVLAFLAARHADISPVWRRRVVNSLLILAGVMAVCAIIEISSPATWSRFVLRTVQLPHYQLVIAGQVTNIGDGLTHGFIGSHSVVRAGSLLFSGLVFGFFMVTPFTLALQRLSERHLRGRFVVLATLYGVAIVATTTRSAILAGLVAAIAVTRVSAARRSPGWLRLAFLLVAAALVVVPIGASSSAGQRIAEAASGTDPSTQGHVTATEDAIRAVSENPLGRGLGTAPGIGERFNVAGHLTSEDAYLQVGNEIGVLSMFTFVGLLGSTIVALGRRARREDEGAAAATALCAAGAGLAVAGFFLHIWLDYATAITFWLMAGLALGTARTSPGQTRLVPSARESF